MRGRPFAEETYSGTLHAFQWVTNDAECYEFLKTSASDMAQRLDGFAARNAPLQAWNNQCTWVPMFDQAAHIKPTLYEDFSAFNWFRGVEGAAAACTAEECLCNGAAMYCGCWRRTCGFAGI